MKQQIPRLAIISSFAGFGRISITAALPVISVMQVQACPLPTSVLSSHLAYSPCHRVDFTDHMQDYLSAWKNIGLSFDGLYVGYISSPKQLDLIHTFLKNTPKEPSDSNVSDAGHTPPLFKSNSTILIDPVLGDHGKAYSTTTPEQIEKMKLLAKQATILTPNLTEACMLTDTDYHADSWTDSKLQCLCRQLDPDNRMQVVITGILEGNTFRNFIWNKGLASSLLIPSAGASRPGTGDIFASILSANALKGKDFYASVQQASDFISDCIRDSEAANTPVKEGVLFEQNLSRLL